MLMDNVLEYASKRYDFDINNIMNINSGSNKVYKLRKNEENYYLRISAREFSYILADTDWINHLKDNIKAPVLVKSNNDKFIELFQEDGQTYVICVFQELPGVFWDKNNAAVWNETVFYNWGSTMGKMHRMTKSYQPPEGVPERPSCVNNLVPLEFYKDIPSVYDKMAQFQKEIAALPRDIDSYGLIHSDMHQQNIYENCTIDERDFINATK